MSRITLAFDSLKTNHGVTVMQGRAVAIDAPGNTLTVSTATGNQILPYDHLVLSPASTSCGIRQLESEPDPHAWQAGPQTTLLKNHWPRWATMTPSS